MRILALETVGTTGSVAAFEDEQVLVETPLNTAQRSAQSLAPGIKALLEQVGWRPADVELVAVATGPGSFTGLRIGVTTAKTFAYVIGCQVIGVHTLKVIASRAPADVRQVTVLLDAQRGELFVGDFVRTADGELGGEDTTRIVRGQDWLAGLSDNTTVTGPGLAKVGQELPPTVVVLDRALWTATAAAVGQVGWQAYRAGQRESVFDLMPKYYRRTAAEEQWEQKQTR